VKFSTWIVREVDGPALASASLRTPAASAGSGSVAVGFMIAAFADLDEATQLRLVIGDHRFDTHRIVDYRSPMTESTPATDPMVDLVRLFKGLADPTRLRMLAAMVDRPRCGQDLAAEVGVSPATVSHHLRVLADAGLVAETRQAPYSFFRLDLAGLQAAVKAVSTPKRVRELGTTAAVDDDTRHVLRAFFDGPRLISLPAQRRKKDIVLEEVLRRLPRRREYREPELNRFIEAVHPDFCTIRREWIMRGYMERKDGVYKLAPRGKEALG
jgi:biotin operon repressor